MHCRGAICDKTAVYRQTCATAGRQDGPPSNKEVQGSISSLVASSMILWQRSSWAVSLSGPAAHPPCRAALHPCRPPRRQMWKTWVGSAAPIAAGGGPDGDRDLTASMAAVRGGGAGAGATGIGGDCELRVERRMPPLVSSSAYQRWRSRGRTTSARSPMGMLVSVTSR